MSERSKRTYSSPVEFRLQDVVLADRFTSKRQPVDRYWLKPTAKNKTVEEYRSMVAAYLNSTIFHKRWSSLKAQTNNNRGIVISAGGSYYLPQAIVLLRVLRYHLKSKLPVEIFWMGAEEMDEATLKAIKDEFAPLEGFDASKLPYPRHHLPGAKLKGFPMKPYALLHSRFKEVMLLDCDVVLMRDPAYMFEAPQYKILGNYFWDDIYGAGMFKEELFDYVGLNRSVRTALDAGKGDFIRYAESGQLIVNRAMHLDVLEWTWFLNSFSDGHVYNYVYGDKDTYGVAFALAGKAHMYQHMNTPPGGMFTHRDALGWAPRKEQMNKQGNWWLHALVHYDHLGEDEVITPPIPHSWSMWYMGYGPQDQLQTTLNVVDLNVTYLLAVSPPGQLCPLAAWAAYWTLRTHGIPVDRNFELEKNCSAMLDVQYGPAAASIIRSSHLLEHPLRLVVNQVWDRQVDGGWKAPKAPLLAVPVNMTAAYSMWTNMNESLQWAGQWVRQHAPIIKTRRRQ
eukprot:gene6257-6495_t